MLAPSFKVIADGGIRIDGGQAFGVARAHWEPLLSRETHVLDRKNRISWEINVVLVQIGGKNILINSGIGNLVRDDHHFEQFSCASASKIPKLLKERHGLKTADINVVVLNSLWFFHAGGCIRKTRHEETLAATFPNATYYVQRAEYEYACSPNARDAPWYIPTTFDAMKDSGKLELLDGDVEILPGLCVVRTNAASRGHQVVFINCGGEHILAPGNIIPTPYHLIPKALPAFVDNAGLLLEWKEQLLAETLNKSMLILFPHGNNRAGYLEKAVEGTRFRPVEL